MAEGLKSVDISGITSVRVVRDLLIEALGDLETLAGITDFMSQQDADTFKSHVAFLKQYYERLEVLARMEGLG